MLKMLLMLVRPLNNALAKIQIEPGQMVGLFYCLTMVGSCESSFKFTMLEYVLVFSH
jgi:hypothetical protein